MTLLTTARGLRTVVVAAVAALAFPACSAGPVAADGVPSDDPVAGNAIRFADADLSGDVQIETPILHRLPDTNLLQLDLPIRNVSGDDLWLLVQVEFFDVSGSPYNDDTGRVALHVPRGSTKQFRATSMQSRAADYRVHMWRNQ